MPPILFSFCPSGKRVTKKQNTGPCRIPLMLRPLLLRFGRSNRRVSAASLRACAVTRLHNRSTMSSSSSGAGAVEAEPLPEALRSSMLSVIQKAVDNVHSSGGPFGAAIVKLHEDGRTEVVSIEVRS